LKNINKNQEFNLTKIFGKDKVDKWLKNYPILKCEDVEKWIIDKIDKYTDEGKEANKFSIPSYLKPLQQYCNYNNTTKPSELLTEDIDQRNFRLKSYLKEFLLNQEIDESKFIELGFRKRPSEVSVRNLIQSRIKSYYSNRGANCSYNMKSKKTGANIREMTLTKDLIKKFQSKLESSNYRLICKLESQTGLRIGDILEELPSGKYIIEEFNGRNFIRNFETQKRKVTINYLFFTKELEMELIANTGIDDLTKLDLKTLFLSRNGKRIDSNNYLQRLKQIVKELGIKGNIKTHAFRKYYISQIGKCSNRLEDPRILTHFEGHEAPYSDQSYLRMTKEIETYFSEWEKTEICVCIDCIAIDKTNKEILQLKEENIKLNQQVDLVLKEKLEFEKTMKEQIALVQKELSENNNEEKILNKFATNLIDKISNFGKNKTEYMKRSDVSKDLSEKDFSNDILMDLLVKKLFETFKQ
jgi:hypothetical protein